MTADRWIESKKGYTLNHNSGERYTVFWTGDKDGPWRVVCRGVYSENFQTVFDGMTYVDTKTGTVSDRGTAKNLDPAKRGTADPYKAHEEAMKRMQVEQEMERQRKAAGQGTTGTQGKSYFQQAADAMREQAKSRASGAFREQFESQFKYPEGDTMQKMFEELRKQQAKRAAEQQEYERRERERQRTEDAFFRGTDFNEFFEKMFRNSGGPWTTDTNYTNSQREQAGPARPASFKRQWQVVLELPGSGPWSEDDVKKQFRKLAMAHHPDRPGGSTEKMAELNTAWEQACAALGIR